MPSADEMAYSYRALNEEGESEKDSENLPIYRRGFMISWWPILSVILILVAFAATAAAGFLAGRLYSVTDELTHEMDHSTHPKPKPIIELGPKTITFKSNRTYLQRPSHETEQLWEGLYPDDGHGLFEWPDENHERTTFAGFHQLHCVDTLRKAWYQEQDVKEALIKGEDISEIPQPFDTTHVLHCVEFLRQTIMCHADTTLQTEASYHQGVIAFGITYGCRDWWQMVDWVNVRNKEFPW